MKNISKYSHFTSKCVEGSVSALPTLLLALHTYLPVSFLVTLLNTRSGSSVSVVFTLTLFFSQIIEIGLGLPSGLHFITTFSPSLVDFVPES